MAISISDRSKKGHTGKKKFSTLRKSQDTSPEPWSEDPRTDTAAEATETTPDLLSEDPQAGVVEGETLTEMHPAQSGGSRRRPPPDEPDDETAVD